ncbi:hypothetical protein E2P81_ATG02513 [Venturia nashicola]|nr:hypothetical protein E2P81_ATG02513 [Venturia nashicola]
MFTLASSSFVDLGVVITFANVIVLQFLRLPYVFENSPKTSPISNAIYPLYPEDIVPFLHAYNLYCLLLVLYSFLRFRGITSDHKTRAPSPDPIVIKLMNVAARCCHHFHLSAQILFRHQLLIIKLILAE